MDLRRLISPLLPPFDAAKWVPLRTLDLHTFGRQNSFADWSTSSIPRQSATIATWTRLSPSELGRSGTFWQACCSLSVRLSVFFGLEKRSWQIIANKSPAKDSLLAELSRSIVARLSRPASSDSQSDLSSSVKASSSENKQQNQSVGRSLISASEWSLWLSRVDVIDGAELGLFVCRLASSLTDWVSEWV